MQSKQMQKINNKHSKFNKHTVCTGLQAQCNATASTSFLRPFCSLFAFGLKPKR